MYTGTMIEELIGSVRRAEQHAREIDEAFQASLARVKRFDNPQGFTTFLYEMPVLETPALMGVA